MDNLISIIVAIYNVEPYIERCIDSILVQNYKNLEIILVDDGSTDSCSRICDNYAKIDNRIKVIHQPNLGLSEARNSGIKIAMGKYVAFVDGDDFISPNMYKLLHRTVTQTNSDISVCRYERNLDNINESSNLREVVFKELSGDYRLDYLFSNEICGNYAWNKLYKKELFDDICFPKGKHYEDMFIMHKVFLKAKKIVLIENKLYYYIYRKGQITDSEISLLDTDTIKALETVLNNKEAKRIYPVLYKFLFNELKVKKRKILQNQNLKDKDTIIAYINNKTRKHIKYKNVGLSMFLQGKILVIFNKWPILYYITSSKKLFKR